MAEEEEKFIEEEEEGCHLCGVPTDGECEFDLDMNPHRITGPRSCCGQHQCAEDV